MEGRTGGKTRKKISDGERRRRKSEGKEILGERKRGKGGEKQKKCVENSFTGHFKDSQT